MTTKRVYAATTDGVFIRVLAVPVPLVPDRTVDPGDRLEYDMNTAAGREQFARLCRACGRMGIVSTHELIGLDYDEAELA